MKISASFYTSKWSHIWVLWFSKGRFLSTCLRVHRWGRVGCHPSMACCLGCCRLMKFLLAPDDKWPGWTHWAWTWWQQMVLNVLNMRLGKFCDELFDNYISAFLKLVPIRKIVFGRVLTTFLISVTKCLEQSYLKEEAFIWALSLKGDSPSRRGWYGGRWLHGDRCGCVVACSHLGRPGSRTGNLWSSATLFFTSFNFHP